MKVRELLTSLLLEQTVVELVLRLIVLKSEVSGQFVIMGRN